MKPAIFAHRGASADAPENTMAAFRLALEQGADGIELDIQMSADGKLVVIHDETLDRTTNGSGLVCLQTADQLRRLSAGKGHPGYADERIPLLEEVLEWIAPTGLKLNIELKNGIIPYPDMEEKAVRLVRRYNMEYRVIFSSFNHYSIAKLAGIAPDIEPAILYMAGLYRPWEYAKKIGARALHPLYYNAIPEIVRGTQEAGLAIRPFTVDQEEDLIRMIRLGVDAVITNHPARMKKLLEEGPV